MSQSVAIIGGGIAGLASAYWLSKRGFRVCLYESSGALGGLGTFFEHDGCHIDRFYHCIMPSDQHLLKLIDDLGLSDRLYWKKTTMSMVYNGKHYPFNSPLDLLGFDPLSFFERLRLGAMSLLLRHLGDDKKLDHTPIEEWLKGLFGQSLWDKFWHPVFAAKFGADAGKLPSLYLKRRLGRESNVSKRGYLEGGLFGLIRTAEQAIVDAGGTVFVDAQVASIEEHDGRLVVEVNDSQGRDFDFVVSTIPLTALSKVAGGVDGVSRLPKLRYQGVVNMLVLLDRSLDDHYWTPSLFSNTGFDGIVKTSTLINTEHYGGRHAAYVMRYVDRNSDLFSLPDSEIAKKWTDELVGIYADQGISHENIIETFVFKAGFVEPVYGLGYGDIQPAPRVGRSNLFLATTAQVYPEITSWNSSIRVADQVIAELLSSAGSKAAGAPEPALVGD